MAKHEGGRGGVTELAPNDSPPDEDIVDDRNVTERLGDLMVESGIVSREDVESAAAAAAESGRPIGEVLVERGLTEQRDIVRALAYQRGIIAAEVVELLRIADPHLSRRISTKFSAHYHVVPVALIGDRVVVATSDARVELPELAQALDAATVEYRLLTPTDLKRLRMALDLGLGGSDRQEDSQATVVQDLLLPGAQLDAEVVSLFDAMMLEAIATRASDIHLERYDDRVRFRLRIDGDLHDISHFHVTPAQYLGVVNVIKIQSRLDIAEHRVPQGGRFSTSAGGKVFDLRVQTQPSLHGEHIVIRLLSKDMEQLYIEQLGLPDNIARTYRRLLNSPSGLILAVGPTGCGKSTTLYAGLHILAKDETRKVITVEDPIECAVDRVQQTQVRPDLGFTFANALRAFLREDPDVILVGEIRDAETALEALRASQTGHIVLSTLHCSDSVDAVQRLFDLGMHPNTVAGELLAVIAQRLAKRICVSCRKVVQPDADVVDEIFPDGIPDGMTFYRGTGCNHCNGFGTHGRIAVVEYLPAEIELRRAISRHLPVDELRALAVRLGLIPLRDHALELARSGIIALEELPMILSPEQLAPPKRLHA